MLTTDRKIDRRIIQEADTFESMGLQVTILAMPNDDVSYVEDRRVVRISYKEFGRLRESVVVDLYRFLRNHITMNGSLMLWLKKIAWRWVIHPEDYYLRLFSKSVAHYWPTVVVAHDLPMLPVAVKLAEKCDAKVIYDSHELYVEQGFSERVKHSWEDIERRYINRAKSVITVNCSIADELKYRYKISMVDVIYNAERRDPQILINKDLHNHFGIPASKKVLLFQGGITANRNLENLVRSIGLLRNEEIVLVMLGEGVLRRRLIRIANELGLQNRIYWDSLSEGENRRSMTASADGGIIPYLGDCLNNYYCTPNKLFEYIGAEIPIVGTALPELRRFINGYGIGLTGDTTSPSAMARLIDQFFMDDKQLILWRNKIRTVKDEVSWENEEEKLKMIYKRIIGTKANVLSSPD